MPQNVPTILVTSSGWTHNHTDNPQQRSISSSLAVRKRLLTISLQNGSSFEGTDFMWEDISCATLRSQRLASMHLGRFSQGNRNHSHNLGDKCEGQSQASKRDCRVQNQRLLVPSPQVGQEMRKIVVIRDKLYQVEASRQSHCVVSAL